MIKAVLFDLGGTLHVTDSPEGRAIWFAERLLARLSDYGFVLREAPETLAAGLQSRAEEYKRETERSLTEWPSPRIWSEYFLRGYGLTAEELEPFAEELSFLYDYERMRCMRRPNLKSTLETLHRMGIRMGIISNIISCSVVPHFLMEYGIDRYMECVITSSSCGIRKPDAGIFRIAQDCMGLEAEELAYVGDTISRDVRGTRNAGWHTMIQIANPRAAHRDAGLDAGLYRPDYRISDLSEIPAIIGSINSAGIKGAKTSFASNIIP